MTNIKVKKYRYPSLEPDRLVRKMLFILALFIFCSSALGQHVSKVEYGEGRALTLIETTDSTYFRLTIDSLLTLSGSENFSHQFEPAAAYVSSYSVSPDGRWLAVGQIEKDTTETSWNGEVAKIRIRNIPKESSWSPDAGWMSAPIVAVDVDGTIFAGGQIPGEDGLRERLMYWSDQHSSAETIAILKEEDFFQRLFLSPNGRTLFASVGGDRYEAGTLWIWDLQKGGQPRKTDVATLGSKTDLVFSPNEQTLALSQPCENTDSLCVSVYDFKRGTLGKLFFEKSVGMSFEQARLAFTPSGAVLAVSTEEGLMLLEGNSGDVVGNIKSEQVISGEPVGLVFQDLGQSLIELLHHADGFEERVWKLPNLQRGKKAEALEVVVQQGHSGGITDINFSPDNRLLATADDQGVIKIWDSSQGRLIQTWRNVPSGTLAFDPTGKFLAAGSSSGYARFAVFEVETGQRVAYVSSEDIDYEDVRSEVLGLGINNMAWHPEGKWLATAGGHIGLWDPGTGKLLKSITSVQDAEAITFSSDGQWLSAGNGAYESYDVHLWETSSLTESAIFEGHNSPVQSLAFSPDGTSLVSSGSYHGDAGLILWDLQAKNQAAVLESDPVSDIIFDATGQYLLTGAGIWDFDHQTLLRPVSKGPDEAKVALRPDGEMLAISTREKLTIQQFNTEPVKRTIEGESFKNAWFAFRPDEKLLAVLTKHKTGEATVELRNVETGKITARAQLSESLDHIGFTSPPAFQFTASGDTLFVGLKETLLLLNGSTLNTLNELPVANKERMTTTGVQFVLHPWKPEIMVIGSGASFAEGSSIMRWDIKEGVVADTLTTPFQNAWSAKYAPNGEKLLVAANDSVAVYQMSTGAWLPIMPVPSSVALSYLFSPDSRWMAARGEQAIYVWDASTGKLRFTFDISSSSVYDLAFNTSSDVLLASSSYSALRWRLDTGARLSSYSDNSAGFSIGSGLIETLPDGWHMAILGSSRAEIIDGITGKISDQFPIGDAYIENWTVSPSGRWLASTQWVGEPENKSINIWQSSLEPTIFDLSARIAPVQSIETDPGAGLLYSASGGNLHIWDSELGTIEGSFATGWDEVGHISVSDDGNSIGMAPTYGQGRDTGIWDKASKEQLQSLPGGQFIDVKATDHWVVASRDSVWLNLPAMDQPIAARLASPAPVEAIDLHPGGEVVAVAQESDSISIINMRDGAVRSMLYHEYGDFSTVEFSSDGVYLVSAKRSRSVDDIIIWDTTTGDTVTALRNQLPFETERGIQALAFSPSNEQLAVAHGLHISLWEVTTGNYLGSLGGHELDVSDLSFNGPDEIVTASVDGQIKVWNVAERREMVTLLGLDNGEFVAVTPDLFYRASTNALKYVAFRQGDHIRDFADYDLQLNRPSIVLKRLGAAPNRVQLFSEAREKRLAMMNISDDRLGLSLERPVIEITSETPTSIARREVQLSLSAENAASPLQAFSATVNEVPLFGRQGAALAGSTRWDTTITVPLSQGENEIELSVRSANGAASFSKRRRMVYTGPYRKPALHLVAIGVSEYEQDKFNLNYADTDTDSLVSFWRSLEDRFSNVHIHHLKNEEAVKENIMALRDTLRTAHVDDLVMVFIAGHGVLDVSSTYYFGTHDFDFDNPSARGISYADIEALLDDIPARQKLLLMDTCHSGEADPDARPGATNAIAASAGRVVQRNIPSKRGVGQLSYAEGDSFKLLKELFADLRQSAGATTIAASAGAEFAFESAEWGGGVFTYTLLRGLRQGLADTNADGRILVSELQEYVRDEVTELTNGRQTPTVRQKNLSNDFQVY